MARIYYPSVLKEDQEALPLQDGDVFPPVFFSRLWVGAVGEEQCIEHRVHTGTDATRCLEDFCSYGGS